MTDVAFAREVEFSKVVFNFFVGLASVHTLTEIRGLSYTQFTDVNYSRKNKAQQPLHVFLPRHDTQHNNIYRKHTQRYVCYRDTNLT